ncbi:ankyrin repeat-containing protein [Ophidiomyces ophidiicola]|nr:ankyrin repeat-containing protein [Ophidiomyces ophidiicola]KAI1994697.1 ankyrin repeat-containing protein [Ophidiomyces ophidiicola]KAI1996169.1 ankyrin repeat-containing protein [Ophidiomyces ophidiicola]KAI2000771.1 ankyrin repeat-containing protein [Ophidiomyces ophidiicola]
MASTIALSLENIDDLIYAARAGDLEGLQTDITSLSLQYNCPLAAIVESAIDNEDESEGGTGACLLHWPAANGNIELLNYLLSIIRNTPDQGLSLVNHANYSGNTPLHWAALNTHLECVKALAYAGASIDVKNGVGHDAAFLAERSEWGTTGGDGLEEMDGEDTAAGATETTPEPTRPMSKAMQVVEYLLTFDRSGEQKGSADVSAAQSRNDGNSDGIEGVIEHETN